MLQGVPFFIKEAKTLPIFITEHCDQNIQNHDQEHFHICLNFGNIIFIPRSPIGKNNYNGILKCSTCIYFFKYSVTWADGLQLPSPMDTFNSRGVTSTLPTFNGKGSGKEKRWDQKCKDLSATLEISQIKPVKALTILRPAVTNLWWLKASSSLRHKLYHKRIMAYVMVVTDWFKFFFFCSDVISFYGAHSLLG